MRKTCIVIAGPTAIGKTPVAIEIAKHFSTQIISADSRQCYQELNIGVAKPSPFQLKSIQHHFINAYSIHDTVSVGIFEAYALNAVENIFLHNDFAVVAGGTGLYIKAFCEGLDMIPADEKIRQRIIFSYQENGLAWLQNEVIKYDPAFVQAGEIKNPHRLMRALEVAMLSGRSIQSFKSNTKKVRNFNIIKVGLELEREKLYDRINIRVEDMLNAGLIEEVRELLPYQHLIPLQTVGYNELFAYFKNESTKEKAISNIKQNTRQYAKRQMTWFKKDTSMNWINCKEGEKIATNILSIVQSAGA